MKNLPLSSKVKLQDIKFEKISEEQLSEMAKLAGSYTALFSKRARLYKEMNLKNKTLSEDDIKQLILKEYTFLKRPILVIDNDIFIGNSSKNVEAMKKVLENIEKDA
jgi:arsenate reductase-like glutaredoxin family protein